MGRQIPKGERLKVFLQKRVWPRIPKKVRGTRLSKADLERILGYGPTRV